MRIVYEPTGAAREYAALACNLYRGCPHGCRYCFGPNVLRMNRDAFHSSPALRDGALKRLELDCADLQAQGCRDEILLCFTCDPYAAGMDTTPTRQALEIIGRHGLNATVLTKGGMAAARDFDLFECFGFRFGTTLVFAEGPLRKAWEPRAATVESRVLALRVAHERGIRTWVSLEPVIDPDQALQVIEATHRYVDEWKVGKINHNRELERRVDWVKFREAVTRLLDGLGAQYMLKRSLLEVT